MIQRCVAWCSRHSRIVIVIAVALAIWGEHARRRLAQDAVPDLSDPQVGLVVEWMGHPASEVATRVTGVLTESLKSVPGVTSVRGASMSGMAYVDVLFGSSKSLEPGRQEIFRRVEDLKVEAALHDTRGSGPTGLLHRLDLRVRVGGFISIAAGRWSSDHKTSCCATS